MAVDTYQPQKTNAQGFTSGVPGIIGGATIPADAGPLQYPSYTGSVDGNWGGGRDDPSSDFLNNETTDERDARMSAFDTGLGKALTFGAGLVAGPAVGALVGIGTGNGFFSKIADKLGFYDYKGQEQTENAAGLTVNEASARAQSRANTGATGTGATGTGATGTGGGFDGGGFDGGSFGGGYGEGPGGGGYGGGQDDGSGGGYGGSGFGESAGDGTDSQGNDGLNYATGGLVEPAPAGPVDPSMMGAPSGGPPGLAPAGAPGAPADPRMVDSQINNLLQTNPQGVQQLQTELQQAIQNGETTPEAIQQLGQIARVVLQNPAMYPQLVKMAEERGIIPAGELPPQYNEGVVKLIMVVARTMVDSPLGQPGTQGQPGGAPIGSPQQNMSTGGPITGPGGPTEDAIPGQNVSTGGKVKVSNGEYIIPAKIVEIKGKEFFDNLLRKYGDVSGERA